MIEMSKLKPQVACHTIQHFIIFHHISMTQQTHSNELRDILIGWKADENSFE